MDDAWDTDDMTSDPKSKKADNSKVRMYAVKNDKSGLYFKTHAE
jgi:hypothetical protein